MKVKPLNDRVLVKRIEEAQVTKGGIAASVASLLITTEAMVAEKPRKEAPRPPMGGGMEGMY
jgi:chaperonin GroEL